MALGGAPLGQQEEEEGLEQHEVAQTWHVTAYPDGTRASGVMQMVWVAACTSEERDGTIPLPPIRTRNSKHGCNLTHDVLLSYVCKDFHFIRVNMNCLISIIYVWDKLTLDALEPKRIV